MSISDHTASFLSALPMIFLAFVVGIIMHFHERPLYFSKEKLENMSDDESLIINAENYVYIVHVPSWKQIIVYTIITVVMFLITDITIFLFFILFYECWKKIGRQLFKNLREYGLGPIVPFAHFFPITIAIAVTWGIAVARGDLQDRGGDYSLEYSTGERIENVVLLRSTQTGLLFREPPRQTITFANWSSIAAIEGASIFSSQSRLCRWFEICWIDDRLGK